MSYADAELKDTQWKKVNSLVNVSPFDLQEMALYITVITPVTSTAT